MGEDVATSVLEFARAVNASQIVVGASRHRPLASLVRRSVGDAVVRGSGAIDVLVVTHEEQAKPFGLPRPARAALSGERRVLGWVVALLGPLAVTGGLLLFPRQDLSTDLMIFLVVVVGAALAGGVLPALAAALAAGLAVNWFFTEPVHQFTIAQPANAVALAVFLLVAFAVSSLVDTSARRTREAQRSRAESEALSVLTRTALLATDPLTEALRHTRETFAVDSVTLLERTDVRSPWTVAAATGDPVCTQPADADAEVVVDDLTCLVLRGRLLVAGDRRVLEVFAAQIAAVRQRQRLRAEAAQVRRLEEGDAVRGALLTAVSHDLRTPLATLKASLDSLRATDIELPEEVRTELLDEVAHSADRLQALIDDLLDLTRVRSGVVEPHLVVVDLDEVVAAAVRDLPGVDVRVPADLPPVSTDPGLLQRVVANLAQNAVRHGAGSGSSGVQVDAVVATEDGHRAVRLLVVDHGPGLPGAAKERAFTPFQRLGDRSTAGWGSAWPSPAAWPRPSAAGSTPRTPRWRADDGARTAPGRARARAGPRTCGRIERVSRVLVVDDEPGLRRALSINLSARGWDVTVAADGAGALEAAAATHPDVVLLDLGLPDLDGLDVIAGIRGWSPVPIIVLTARTASADAVDALDAGADDYVTKPFAMDVLLARLRAAVRRGVGADNSAPEVLDAGGLHIDLARRTVSRDGEPVKLTPTEWHLLQVLVTNAGRLVSQTQLLQEVWGPAYGRETNYLRVYVGQLRRKLEETPSAPQHLITEPGMGYRFEL